MMPHDIPSVLATKSMARLSPVDRHGHSGQADRTGFILAERLRRTADRIDPARVFGPHHCLGRGASHLRRILKSYADYYNGVRTHRSSNEDAPVSRQIQRTGSIKSHALLGGLHQHYVRV